MAINFIPISVTYSTEWLRKEYITMKKHDFTFKDLCSYVLYWAKEESKTANKGLYESNELDKANFDRLNKILEKVAQEGRIVAADDNTKFVKTKE